MPEYAVGLLESVFGDLGGARVVVLGAAYRGGVKETAFSGVFPTVAALESRGARVWVHDPLYSDAELADLGLAAYQGGDPVDAAIVQTDHADYGQLRAADLPGLRVLVDGRRVTSPDNWPGVTHRTVGVGVAVATPIPW
jgi:UDP-N-acetyl-D-mannosaminuronate dehydrogenase